MPDKKLTDNEIIKALNKCLYGYKSCDECPLCNDPCEIDHGGVPTFITDLINRQKAENSNLTSCLTSLQNDLTSAKAEIERLEAEALKPIIHNAVLGAKLGEEIKANAIKEFAERLKAQEFPYGVLGNYIVRVKIDNLVKEMVGDSNV